MPLRAAAPLRRHLRRQQAARSSDNSWEFDAPCTNCSDYRHMESGAYLAEQYPSESRWYLPEQFAHPKSYREDTYRRHQGRRPHRPFSLPLAPRCPQPALLRQLQTALQPPRKPRRQVLSDCRPRHRPPRRLRPLRTHRPAIRKPRQTGWGRKPSTSGLRFSGARIASHRSCPVLDRRYVTTLTKAEGPGIRGLLFYACCEQSRPINLW